MATTAQIDAALTLLRSTRARLAQCEEAEAHATLVRDVAVNELAAASAATVNAQADADAAKNAAVVVLNEVEI
jgi:hypothetical protein